MNHVTAEERRTLLNAAMHFTVLAEDGSVVDFQQTTDEFAKAYGISLARARGAVSKAARIKRGEIVKSRPGPEPMGDGMQPTVTAKVAPTTSPPPPQRTSPGHAGAILLHSDVLSLRKRLHNE